MARGTVVQKIIEAHFVEGSRETGKPVAIRIDQTLTQDATGTMAYLELEAMNVPGVKTELSTTCICRASRLRRASVSRLPATASATRSTSSASACRARR